MTVPTGEIDSDFLVTIRAAGERTEEICRQIVEQQANGQPVQFIRETPFKKSLERCFEIALESRKKWLITVDADMLLTSDALSVLLKYAEEMPENYIQLQGKIFDKITGSIRKAGPRIYRVGFLEQALQYSLQSKDHIRPEGSLVTALGTRGMPSRYISRVTAYHDFEQYFKDLYRKAFVHARKHSHLAGELIQRSIENKASDRDYQVILKAVWEGLEGNEKISIDTTMFEERSEKALAELGINEKEPMNVSANPEQFLETIQKKNPLNQAGPIYYSDQPFEDKSLMSDFIRILKRDGVIHGVLHGFGVFLVRVGKKLKIDN